MSTQIKISDPALIEVLKTWSAAQKKFKESYGQLQAQYNQECQTLLDDLNRAGRDSFVKLCDSCSIPGDPLEHFKTGAWFVDFSYFEQHGDGYLCQADSPVDISTLSKPPEEKKHQLQ